MPESQLTSRQRQFLLLRGRGLTEKEAAEHMGVSYSGIHSHRAAAYRKLGAQNIIEAFLALGWLRIPHDETNALLDFAALDAAEPGPSGLLRKRVVANFRARVVKWKGTRQALDYGQMLDWAWDEEESRP